MRWLKRCGARVRPLHHAFARSNSQSALSLAPFGREAQPLRPPYAALRERTPDCEPFSPRTSPALAGEGDRR